MKIFTDIPSVWTKKTQESLIEFEKKIADLVKKNGGTIIPLPESNHQSQKTRKD